MNGVGKHLTKLVLLGILAATPVLADVPTQMPIQGRLTNSAGAPVPAGLKFFTFKIFDAASGGTEIWPAGLGETQTLASDVNGLWSGSIGLLVPLTPDVFQSPVRWLQITVDNGVDPAEILPRLQLKTNPYTYRSATSQHADSLGGSTLFDLALRFVDQSGDVMTGVLENNFTQNNAGASLRVHNFNDGWGFHWNDGQGNWGLAADVGGDNANFNVGVAGSAGGNDNIADANYGLLGFASGSGSMNVGVYASTDGTGIENLSAYFFGGDVLVSSPVTPGTGGVLLPADAIDATEILNEPGIVSETNPAGIDQALTSTTTDVQTVTITIPADGYIRVVGNAYCWITGAVGDNAVGFFQIDETSGGAFTIPYGRLVGAYSRPGAQNSFHPVSVERTYFKTAGTYTFRLEGAEQSVSGTGGVWTIWPIVTATYFPTAYGTVAAVVASSESGDFERASAVRVESAASVGGGAPSDADPMFSVDLRELELKVARADAEAEKARRELVEAKLSAMRRPGHTSDNMYQDGKP